MFDELGAVRSDGAVPAFVGNCAEEVRAWLVDGQWRHRFPGKRLLESFSSDEDLGQPVVLVNSLIKEFGSGRATIPLELVRVVADVVEGRPLGMPQEFDAANARN